MPEHFRILFVCTGNICRSALAERWTCHQLEQRLGEQARVIEVTSAGVRAVVGAPLDLDTAASLAELGGSDEGFCARQLEEGMLEDADLILVATRKHRATAARLLPSATTRTFTMREFGRLAQYVDVVGLPEAGARERLVAAVRSAAALRGTVVKDAPGADDVSDPYGQSRQAHLEAGAMISSALEPVIDLLVAAVDAAQAAATAEANRGRRTARRQAREAAQALRPTPRQRRLRALIPALVVLPVIGVLALLGYQALTARAELNSARREVPVLKAAALDGDAAGAQTALRRMQKHTATARSKLAGPLWSAAETLPGVGDDVSTVRTVASTVDDVSHDVLPPLIQVAGSVNPKALRVKGNQIALGPLLDAGLPLRTASARAAEADRALAGLVPADLLGPVRGQVEAVQEQVSDLAEVTANASAAAEILPPLLGADGKKTYFLAFQNNAEARGTGGLLGAYGILQANNGRLRITRLGSNQELENPPSMPVNLGKDFTTLYGDGPRLWINANVSPHFPYAARIWMASWKRQHGKRLDGVIATDPVAMGYVLAATGPARLPNGQQITSDNAARLTMRDVYERYPSVSDNPKRDRYLQDIADAVFTRVLAGQGSPRALADALGKAAGERRLLVFSADQAVQARLADYPLAGVVPRNDPPYVGVSVNSAVPSKLDYYLDRSIGYVSRTCTSAGRRSRITATFTNTAPARGLPPYVAFPPHKRPVELKGTPRGTNYLFVDVAVPEGSGLVRARIDGRPTTVLAGRERGRPVFRYKLILEPGKEKTLTFDLLEPRLDAVDSKLTVLRQPLVLPPTITTDRISCLSGDAA